MGMLNKFRYLFQIGAAFICIILTACSSALGTTPNPTPSPAFNRVEVEQELVATLLDSVLHDLRVYSIADMTLIVLSPVQGSQESPDWRMNIDDPLKAWWFDGDQLTEASDPQAAIEQFRQDYLTQDIYGLYDFGILSIAQDGQSAEVYRGYDCGFECHGTASYFTLERNDAGEWGDIGTGVTLIE